MRTGSALAACRISGRQTLCDRRRRGRRIRDLIGAGIGRADDANKNRVVGRHHGVIRWYSGGLGHDSGGALAPALLGGHSTHPDNGPFIWGPDAVAGLGRLWLLAFRTRVVVVRGPRSGLVWGCFRRSQSDGVRRGSDPMFGGPGDLLAHGVATARTGPTLSRGQAATPFRLAGERDIRGFPTASADVPRKWGPDRSEHMRDDGHNRQELAASVEARKSAR